MAKKKKDYRRRPSRKKGRRRDWTSILIPVVVGVVVLAVIVAAIVSIENQRTSDVGVRLTSQPLETRSIPHPDVPRISLEETQRRLKAGEAILVDVRSQQSYNQAHAVGALSFPESEVDRRLDELPRELDLILY